MLVDWQPGQQVHDWLSRTALADTQCMVLRAKRVRHQVTHLMRPMLKCAISTILVRLNTRGQDTCTGGNATTVNAVGKHNLSAR